MAWSAMLVLVVKCVGKFSLPEGGLIILFLVFLHYNPLVICYAMKHEKPLQARLCAREDLH